jgi:hypothetical protein
VESGGSREAALEIIPNRATDQWQTIRVRGNPIKLTGRGSDPGGIVWGLYPRLSFGPLSVHKDFLVVKEGYPLSRIKV